MRIFIAIVTALAITAAYYAALLLIDRKRDLELIKNKYFIKSKSVYAVMILTLATAVYMGIKKNTYQNIILYLMSLTILWGTSVIAVTDYKKRIIPNKFLLLLIGIWLLLCGGAFIMAVNIGLAVFFSSFVGGVFAGVVFFLCYFISRKQLGAGDVKLAFVMGLLMTGQRIVGPIVYGALLSCVYCIVQMLRKKLKMKDAIPFAPFLYIGTVITLIIV